MGLDQYAYAVTKEEKMLLDVIDEIPLDELQVGEKATEPVLLQKWRKHANLNQWMENLYYANGGGEEFNCVHVWITKDDLDVLEADVLEGCLPHGEGFFWGVSTEEDKTLDLEFIKKAREAIDKGLEVYYTCWW